MAENQAAQRTPAEAPEPSASPSRIPIPGVRIYVPVSTTQKNPVFWGIIMASVLVVLVAILLLVFGIWQKAVKTEPAPSQPIKVTLTADDTFATKTEVSVIREATKKDVASLKGELATVTTLVATKNDLTKVEKKLDDKIALAVKELKTEVAVRQAIDSRKITPPPPAKEPVAVSAPIWRVNILLVDEYGRVPECYKGVRVQDITVKGNHTHFLFDGKPIDWNQKVVLSYSYLDNAPPITGTIYYTPEGGAASKVINVPPCNVYQDSDGSIRYDDLQGGFPLAPKGAGYITAQSTLPTQQ